MTIPTQTLLPMMMYCFVMSITPGPQNMILTASGATFGFRPTLPQVFGINAGLFVLTALACLGLGGLFMALPGAQVALRAVGAAYLVYLAWKLARARMADAQSPRPRPLTFVEGALFQAVNPKCWVRSFTMASVFMPVGSAPVATAFFMAGVSAVIGVPCVSAWALFGVAIRRFLKDARNQRIFNLLMAASLLALALTFLF
ncbi:MAG: LysE family translocator [Burkholderiaceae bacterium]